MGRPRLYQRPSKEEFSDLYDKHTTQKMASMFGCSGTSISHWARDFGCKRKKFKRLDHPEELTPFQKDIVIGSMLGDATLTKVRTTKCNSQFCVSHCKAQMGLLEWMSDHLTPYSQSIREVEFDGFREVDGEKDVRYDLATCRHPSFTKMEREWYKRDDDGNYVYKLVGKSQWRIKVVPEIKLNPTSIAVWFWDDGHLSAKNRSALFCTNGFTKIECEFLVGQLEGYGISSYVWINPLNHPLVMVRAKSVLDLVEMIREDVPPSMEYKVDLTECTRPQRRFNAVLSDEQVKGVQELLQKKTPQIEIAHTLNVDKNIVSSIYRGNRYQDVTGIEKDSVPAAIYHSSSGINGVRERNGNQIVYIIVNGEQIYLGAFPNKETAIKVRTTANQMREDGVRDSSQYKKMAKPFRKKKEFSEKGKALRKATMNDPKVKDKLKQSALLRPPNNGYKGVSFNQRQDKFKVSIWVNGKSLHLGWFDDDKEAALNYDFYAAQKFEECYLNFPDHDFADFQPKRVLI